MSRWQSFNRWIADHHEVGFDLIRIYLGVGLVIKAFFFMQHRDYLLEIVKDAGTFWPVPMALLHYVIPIHLAGGIMLALGVLTRLAALVQIPILAGATFYVYFPRMMQLEPRQQLEFTALVLVLLVMIAVFGAGPWSLDEYFRRRRATTPPSAAVKAA